MITLKCSMCNANLTVDEGEKIVTCEFCGATQVLADKKGENSVKRGYLSLEVGYFQEANDYFDEALDENAESSEAYLGKVLVAMETRTKEDFFDLSKISDLESLLRNLKYELNYKKAVRFAHPELQEKLTGFRNDVYEQTYNKASALMNDGDYYNAIGWFKWIEEYKDTANLLVNCEISAKNEEQENDYEKAVEYMDKQAYSNAIGLFQDLKDYRDSAELVNECKYRRAKDYKKSEEYMDAIEIFKEIIDYKDSRYMLNNCENVVKERKYLYAKEKLENATTDVSVEKAKKIFEELQGYKESTNLIKECQKEIAYINAKLKMKDAFKISQWKECQNEFQQIKGYKDATKLAKKCGNKANLLKFLVIPVAIIIVAIVAVLLLASFIV